MYSRHRLSLLLLAPMWILSSLWFTAIQHCTMDFSNISYHIIDARLHFQEINYMLAVV